MPIDLTAPPVPISFELYPPRTPEREARLHETVRRLAAVDPRFISVTYGAGGSVGGRSLELLRHIQTTTDVVPLAHLTCVGSTYEGASELIREFLDAGITSFLALRGDPPADAAEDDPFLGDIATSAELVQLIQRVQAERTPYVEAPVPGIPDAARVEPGAPVDIAVATFPNGHPRSRHEFEHIDALLAKEAAGATLAITQLFFHADDYFAFVQRCRAAGVTVPILPGIMPITSPARLRRVLELSGEALPAALSAALEAEQTPDGQRAVGVAQCAELAAELVAGGVPGIHLYAFNDHTTVLAVLRDAGIFAPTTLQEDLR